MMLCRRSTSLELLQRRCIQCAVALAGILVTAVAAAQTTVLDDFSDVQRWELIRSDGVQAEVTPAVSPRGKCLRLDYDFTRGAGFCALRLPMQLDLPANYRFTVGVRGDGLANNLEFKLVDPTGDNVWWVNRRAFEPTGDWQVLRQRARHFVFAWGPSGGAPLKRIGSIEFAVAANAGGKGTFWFDELTFEELPEPQVPTQPPTIEVSSNLDASDANTWRVKSDGHVGWRSVADNAQSFTLDFGVVRELGGLKLQWADDRYPTSYEVQLSNDKQVWDTVAAVLGATGGTRYVQLPDAEGRFLRVVTDATNQSSGVTLEALEVLDVSFGSSGNAMYTRIAQDAPRGHYPRYFLREQPEWTIVGVAQDAREALVDTDGAVEFDECSARLEPFLLIDGKLVTWADVETRQSLECGYLPIPTVTWQAGDVALDITAVAHGKPGDTRLRLRYRLRAKEDREVRNVSLLLAVRPFQVLPPWQDLNLIGGVTRVKNLELDARGGRIDDTWSLQLDTPASAYGATTHAGGECVRCHHTRRRRDRRVPRERCPAGEGVCHQRGRPGERVLAFRLSADNRRAARRRCRRMPA